MELNIEIADVRLIRKIGRGAYGEVWVVEDQLGHLQAAKIIEVDASEEESSPELSEKEWKGLQHYTEISREHPELLTIYRLGRSRQFIYYLMDLADPMVPNWREEGLPYRPKTLRKLLASSRGLSREDCMEYAESLARGMACFHRNRLIHRDIKPSNIVIVGGKPRLADIGLVRLIDDERSFAGTEGFVPPEGPGDARGDIFSLGKVFYRMLTGQPIDEFPVLPADCPSREDHQLWFADFNNVISKCTRPNVSDRYQSAEALLEDLAYLKEGKSLTRRQRRNFLIRTTGLLASLFMVLWLIAYFFESSTRQPSPLSLDKQIIPAANWDFSQGNLSEWRVVSWQENMQLLKESTATGKYIYHVEEWDKGATLATPVFEVMEDARLFVRYQRSGPSSCEVFVGSPEGDQRLLTLAGNDVAPQEGFAFRTFDLSDFTGQRVYVAITGGSVSLDYLYVEQSVVTVDQSVSEPALLVDGGEMMPHPTGMGIEKSGSILGLDEQLPAWVESELVAFYPFNSTPANALDPNQQNAPTKVRMVTDRFGVANRAAFFNGQDSMIQLETVPSLLELEGQLTLTAWVLSKGPSVGSKLNHDTRCIFSPPNHIVLEPGGGFLMRLQGEGKLGKGSRLSLRVSKPTTNSTSQDAVSDDVWHWLVASVSEEGISLYIDGQASEVLSSEGGRLSPAVEVAQRYFSIGRITPWADTAGPSFHGAIDDLAIYRRSLSQEEVSQLYTLELAAGRDGEQPAD